MGPPRTLATSTYTGQLVVGDMTRVMSCDVPAFPIGDATCPAYLARPHPPAARYFHLFRALANDAPICV
jgi:hypothetical protein